MILQAIPTLLINLISDHTKDFRASRQGHVRRLTAAITLAFLFVEISAMYWEGFTLAVCLVLESACTE